MIFILTQNNGAIINADNITAISIVATEDGKFDIVADQNYILGVYETEKGVVYDVLFCNNSCGFHYRTEVFHETILENLNCGFYSIVYKYENF